MRRLIGAALFLAIAPPATAQDARDNCWVQAGARYGVSPYMLVAIATQESRLKADAVNRNKNGTIDYGLMGINTIWLKSLAQFGITESHLMQPCINVHIGAWIYSQRIKEFGNTWRAVGAYRSRTPSLSAEYISAIQRHYQVLLRKVNG